MAMANSTGQNTTSQAGTPATGSLAYQLTSGKAYNPDAYYLDASDQRGHSEQFNIKIPPRIEHVMDIIVAESDQYRTRQDFARDAMFHWAHHRATTASAPDPLAEALLEAEASRARTEMRKRLREEQTADMMSTREFVEDLIADKDWTLLNEEVDRVAMLSEDDHLPAGIRERYNDLWHEMNDAIFRSQAREFRKANKGKPND